MTSGIISFTDHDKSLDGKHLDKSNQVQNAMKVKHISGDGRCFFRAVVTALNDDMDPQEETVQADLLRRSVVDYMRTNRDELFPKLESEYWDVLGGFEEHLNHMMRTSEYAGEPEIIATARLHDITIRVHYATEPGVYTSGLHFTDFGNGSTVINVLHLPDRPNQPGHFDLLLPEDCIIYTDVNGEKDKAGTRIGTENPATENSGMNARMNPNASISSSDSLDSKHCSLSFNDVHPRQVRTSTTPVRIGAAKTEGNVEIE